MVTVMMVICLNENVLLLLGSVLSPPYFSVNFVSRLKKVSNFVYFYNCCDSVIVEALKVDSLQKLCSSLEPILRRVVRYFLLFLSTLFLTLCLLLVLLTILYICCT